VSAFFKKIRYILSIISLFHCCSSLLITLWSETCVVLPHSWRAGDRAGLLSGPERYGARFLQAVFRQL